MKYGEVQIANLRAEERSINLIEYYGRVSVHLGSAAFSLLGIPEEAGLHPSTVSFSEQKAGYQREILPRSADLEPGNSVRIGRRRGLEIFDAQGEVDEARMAQIYNPGLQASLKSDIHLSKEHLEIEVVEASDLIIRDLGSTNGTIVKYDDWIPDEGPVKPVIRRGNLRLVE
ncbi:MAG: hypothetical protein JWO96_63 [Candidatus Saccharibacteria bacterium]|nr:hypothetical protein [Candidatus Saccharibacteria bacterium]